MTEYRTNREGKMIKFTHKKRNYYALCVQYDGTNAEYITDILGRAGCEVHPYGEQLMLRWRSDWYKGHAIDTMKAGYWVRIGENDMVKIMSPEEFDLKYQAI